MNAGDRDGALVAARSGPALLRGQGTRGLRHAEDAKTDGPVGAGTRAHVQH